MPTGAYGTVFNDPRARVEDRHAYVHGGWEGALPGGWQSQFRAAYDTYEYVGRYPYDWDADPDTPVVNYMDVGSGDWVGGEALFSRPLGRRHHLTVGTEHRTNIRQLQEGYLDDPYELQWRDRRHSSTSAVFVQDEFRAHRKLLLNVGLRQDHYANFRDPLKPRVAAICQPGSRTTMKAVFGEAFRAPNVFESHYVTPGYYMANPSVRPEEIRTVEGVIEHYAGRRLRLSGSVFTYDVENLINFTLDPEDGLLYYDNIESAHAAGVELEAEAKWPAGVQARLSYAYTRARSDDTGDVLTNSPAHVTQGLFSTPLRAGAIVGVDVRALSSRRTVSGRVVGAHVVPNVTLSGAVGDQRLRYSFTVSNFTNTSYADPVGEDFLQPALVQNGRTARLRLTWAF
jgi:iron complex outermembrane receptor protein